MGSRKTVFTSISSMLIGFGLGCALIRISGSEQPLAVQNPTIKMALSAMQPAMTMAEARAAKAAGAVLRSEPPFRRGMAAKGLMSTLNFAARDGFKAGCRGQLIIGTPTWHTGADEQRYGTRWDDLLEEIR